MDHVLSSPPSLGQWLWHAAQTLASRVGSALARTRVRDALASAHAPDHLIAAKRLARFAVDNVMRANPELVSFEVTFWSPTASHHGRAIGAVTVGNAVVHGGDVAAALAAVRRDLAPHWGVLSLTYLGHAEPPAVTQHIRFAR